MNLKKLIPIAFAIIVAIIARFLNSEINIVGILLAMGVGAGLGAVIKLAIFKES